MKNLLARFLQVAAPLVPFRHWQAWSGARLFLPFYHLVSDAPPPHVRHLYPVRTVRQFREDLSFLLQHFQPVGLEDLWRHVFEGKTFGRPVSHLSFDDGLRECHDVAMPILLEKGIPATFFLNSDFVDNAALMFRYKASLLRDSGAQLPDDPLKIRYTERHLLDDWAKAAGVDFSRFLLDYQPYMTVSQVKNLQKNGFTIGAHSLDHPQYDQLPKPEQLHQTVACFEALQEHFDLPRLAFAFPFTDDGVGISFFQNLAEKMGAPVLSFGGAGLKRDVAPAHLQRFAMERTRLPARQIAAAEYAAYLGKKALGAQVVRRQK
jgi:peptidoglycan/xylan/chitin deacetylase (PgdA/CDA1 family)